MQKTLKLCLIIFLLFTIINVSFVQATEGEASVPEVTSEVSEEELPVIEEQANTGSSLDTLSNSGVTKISNLNSYEQANLELNNILCIILIAIGVLLILFAIALLIRLSK